MKYDARNVGFFGSNRNPSLGSTPSSKTAVSPATPKNANHKPRRSSGVSGFSSSRGASPA